MKTNFTPLEAIIFTDGSCHTQKRVGAWVAIVLIDEEEIILQGIENDTTHHRMELLAVVNGINYVCNNNSNKIVMHVFTDSQYVVGLQAREYKLLTADFKAKSGKSLPHVELVKSFYHLLKKYPVTLNKVKAHQRSGEAMNYNEVADKLVRSMVRAAVK